MKFDRLTNGLLVLLVIGVWGLLIRSLTTHSPTATQPAKASIHFDKLTVGRLNIAGPDGVNRFVLCHTAPQAPFQGQMLKRTVPPGMSGMIHCAPNGDEVGGIGVSGDATRGHALLALDYRNTPLEAIGIATHYGPDGQSANLVIMDPPRGTIDVRKLNDEDKTEIARLQQMMIERVSLGVDPREASLILRDQKGRERIVLRIDQDGEPSIRVLDAAGKEVGRLPSAQ